MAPEKYLAHISDDGRVQSVDAHLQGTAELAGSFAGSFGEEKRGQLLGYAHDIVSAENQATDRTYRIGQKKNVQVYKLITKNSIEEKIYELQKRKETLIDSMLSVNQTFISKLSKEDIMNLFE